MITPEEMFTTSLKEMFPEGLALNKREQMILKLGFHMGVGETLYTLGEISDETDDEGVNKEIANMNEKCKRFFELNSGKLN